MSKALGCKRVHDDRIAGVTFEKNASRNALIMNEEYAWVGNPFSAHEVLFEGPFCWAILRNTKQTILYANHMRDRFVFAP